MAERNRASSRRRPRALPDEPIGIGDALRNAREAKNISVERASLETRIRTEHIHSLEDEDFHRLPPAVFARGFLRSYSSYLGLNPDELLSMLDGYELLTSEPTTRPHAFKYISNPTSTWRYVVIALAISLSLGLGYYLLTQYQTFVASQPVIDQPLASTAQLSPSSTPGLPGVILTPIGQPTIALTAESLATPIAVSSPALPVNPTPSPTETAIPLSPTPTVQTTVTIEARLSGKSWVQVEVDDKVVYQGTLAAGERKSWTGKKILIWAGNAGAVDIVFNGRPLGKLGASGEVIKTTWTAS